jgi:hypothetical protein
MLERIDRAKLRVSAAASFGDVVEEGGDVEQPRAIEVADQLAAERIFVAEFAPEKRRRLRSTRRMCWSTV